MKRLLITIVIVMAIIGGAAPLFPLNFLKPRIAAALEKGLGRRVEIDTVYLTLFSGPGFSLEGVTISEDPRAGVEPFAYATTLDARVDLPGLLQGRRGFSLLNFGDATLNLVKRGDQPWNVQMLLDARAAAPQMPAVRMRAGRVNVKVGDTKSRLFFDDVDLDVSPGSSNTASVRISGVPARTDRSGLDFGHFFVQGTYAAAREGAPALNLAIEQEASSLDSIARLFDQGIADWQGSVTGTARIAGTLDALKVTGNARLADAKRSELLQFAYKGGIDFVGQHLSIETEGARPIAIRFDASDFLASPVWSVSCRFDSSSVSETAGVLRKIGIAVPEKLAVKGDLLGSVSYSPESGFAGDIAVEKGSIALPENRTADLSPAHLTISPQSITLLPVTLTTDIKETARLEGAYFFAGRTDAVAKPSTARQGSGLDLKITTRALPVKGLESLGITGVPLPSGLTKGTIRGALRFYENSWSGDYDLQNAEFNLNGLAEPLRVSTVSVRATAEKVAATRMKGMAGDIGFEGEYQRNGAAGMRDHLRLVITTGSIEEVERLFRPTLVRGGGFLQRTLRIGNEPATPDWITKRKVDGTVAIRSLTAAGQTVNMDPAKLEWVESSVSLRSIEGKVGAVRFSGEVNIDVKGAAPAYSFNGKVQEIEVKGGTAELEGKVQAAGIGTAFLSSIRSDGTFKVRSVTLSPDLELRNAVGGYSMDMSSGAPRWQLSDVVAFQGVDMFTGAGAIQPDAKITLDLTGRGKPLKITGSLAGQAIEP